MNFREADRIARKQGWVRVEFIKINYEISISRSF